MKFLVSVRPNPNVGPPPPEQLPALLRGSNEILNLQLAQGNLDVVYSTGQNEGFAIADADSVEEVWRRVNQNPLAAFWEIEVTALGDPIQITEDQLAQLEIGATAAQ